MKRAAFLCLILVAALIAALGPSAPAYAQTEGLTMTAVAGLDGYCKQGMWLPVRITLENNGGDIEGIVTASIAGANPDWRFSTQVSLPSVSRKELTLYVIQSQPFTSIDVTLSTGATVLAASQPSIRCVQPGDALLGVWAASPSVFNPQTGVRTAGSRASLVQVDARSIPDRPQGLAMLDVLTISGVDTAVLTDAQRESIAVWVANGGRLLVAGGTDWLAAAAGLEDLLPLVPSASATIASLDGLPELLRIQDLLDGSAVAATGTLHPGSEVLFSAGDVPVIVLRRHGFGEVIYLSVDPAQEPLRTWVGAEMLYQYLIGSPLDTPAWSRGFQEWFDAYEALNAIPGLGMPPVWLVCGFILAYIVAIGPANFLLLRVLKRRESAWLTVPIIVVISTGCILFVGVMILGNRPVVNRLALVEVWPEEDLALVHGLVGVFSPNRETFSLEMKDGFLAHPAIDPGFSPGSASHEVRQTDEGFSIPELRIDLGGLEGYAVAGTTAALPISYTLDLVSQSAGRTFLFGEVRNDSGITLHDAMLLSPTTASSLGDIPPGESAQISITSFGGASSPSGSAANNPGFGGDDTLFNVFGSNYLYSSNQSDLEEFRRFNLLSSALGGPVGSRGGQIYLLGWSDQAPFDTELSGQLEQTVDTTLYIFHLTAAAEPGVQADGSVLLTPDWFRWSVFEVPTGVSTASAYNGFLSSGSYSLQFVPIRTAPSREVVSLTLSLQSYGLSGPAEVAVELWDFTLDAWAGQPPYDWGDNEITAPERYVGPAGEIRIRLSSDRSVDIERADFTLVVRP